MRGCCGSLSGTDMPSGLSARDANIEPRLAISTALACTAPADRAEALSVRNAPSSYEVGSAAGCRRFGVTRRQMRAKSPSSQATRIWLAIKMLL
jgi:hypothetical protein